MNHGVMGSRDSWYQDKGSKMEVYEIDLHKRTLQIRSNGALLGISHVDYGEEEWLLGWFILHQVRCKHKEPDKSSGVRVITSTQLADAFGLGNHEPEDWTGIQVAEQGIFIRHENYLNIPCAGTGRQWDPNISIYISDEIREAVRRILNRA